MKFTNCAIVQSFVIHYNINVRVCFNLKKNVCTCDECGHVSVWEVAPSSSYAKPSFKKYVFTFPFLIIINIILKLNIKLYYSKKSLFFMKL